MIRPSRVFTVVPTIPQPLSALVDLAYNLRWTWDHQTAGLFRRLDPARWEATNHNPVLLLRSTDQVRLNEAAREYKEVATNPLNDGPCQASPAVSQGQIFIRTAKNLYCIGKRR